MKRTVAARLEVTVQSTARLAVQVAVADPGTLRAEETIDITLTTTTQPGTRWTRRMAAACG
jgi:hypothetical protein